MMGLNESNMEEQSVFTLSRFLSKRSNEIDLEKYITAGEIEYPIICENYGDEYDYADVIIKYTLDRLISEFISSGGSIEYDNQEDINAIDNFIDLCKDIFGDYLLDVYRSTCSDEDIY